MVENNVKIAGEIPTIAIVGRPNVGKSALFNAILRRRLAIVHEMSGVTRDRIIAPVSWRGFHFQLVDTGGLGTLTGETRNVDRWDKGIREQVDVAIEDADILVFAVNIHACDVAASRYIWPAAKRIIRNMKLKWLIFPVWALRK